MSPAAHARVMTRLNWNATTQGSTAMAGMRTRLKPACTIGVAAVAALAGEAVASDYSGLLPVLWAMYFVCFLVVYAVAWALSTLVKSRGRRMLVHAVVLGVFFAPSLGFGWAPALALLFLGEHRAIAFVSIAVSIAVIWLVLWGMLGPAKDRLHLRDEVDAHKNRNGQ
ncbi:hypothetical protein ASD86_05040 [Lysobacter sp. Root690]|nr:hypothetical protein ASD86_05040 [Lysobacter sp. Root690]